MHLKLKDVLLSRSQKAGVYDLLITGIDLYDDDGKYMHGLKLNGVMIDILEKAEIDLTEDLVHKLSNV